jgi:hypothetical protein
MIVQHVAVHVENVLGDFHQILEFVNFFPPHVEGADIVQPTVDDAQSRSLQEMSPPREKFKD